MKKSLKWMFSLGVVMATSGAFAQPYGYGAPLSSSSNTGTNTNNVSVSSSKEESHSQTFSRTKDLVGANVKDSQGNKLGDIDEILINPQNGETFASVGISGRRYALIPIQALSISRPAGVMRNAEVSLNTTKQALESGPSLSKNEWHRLDSQSFVQSIYSHYNVQQPSATGGVSGSSMSGSSSGASSSETNNTANPKK